MRTNYVKQQIRVQHYYVGDMRKSWHTSYDLQSADLLHTYSLQLTCSSEMRTNNVKLVKARHYYLGKKYGGIMARVL